MAGADDGTRSSVPTNGSDCGTCCGTLGLRVLVPVVACPEVVVGSVPVVELPVPVAGLSVFAHRIAALSHS